MIKELEAAIGYKFKNIALLQNALAHSSYANERWHNSLMSNERLEFLGIKKAVIKAHGSSDALAFRNAINQAAKAAEADFSQELETGLKELAAMQQEAAE